LQFDPDDVMTRGVALFQLGAVQMMTGEVADGIESLQQADLFSRQTHNLNVIFLVGGHLGLAHSQVDQPLVDPLSQRELEILTLIAAGLKNREIAERLIISLNTVLYHVKNIYSKLSVNKRALAIAKEINLI